MLETIFLSLLSPMGTLPTLHTEVIDQFLYSQATPTSGSQIKIQDIAVSRDGEISALMMVGPFYEAALRTRQPDGEWVDHYVASANSTPGFENAYESQYDRDGNLYLVGDHVVDASTQAQEAYVYRFNPGQSSPEPLLTIPSLGSPYSPFWESLALSRHDVFAWFERVTTDATKPQSSECLLFRSSFRKPGFHQIAEIPDCHNCFNVAVSQDGHSLAASCKTQLSPSGSSAVATTPDVVLSSDDGGRSWNRQLVPMFEAAPYGYWNGRGHFDREGNWYGLHLEVVGLQGKFNVYRSYLVKRSARSHELTYRKIPLGDNAGLYCKNLVIVSDRIFIACGGLKPNSAYSAIVLSTHKRDSDFDLISEYVSAEGDDSSYLGLTTDGHSLFSGIEDAGSDRSRALLGVIPIR